MYEGIHVSMFQLFHGETIQYYITESYAEDGGYLQEHVTQSGTLYGKSEAGIGSNASGKGQYDTDDRLKQASHKKENKHLHLITLAQTVEQHPLVSLYYFECFLPRILIAQAYRLPL